MCRWERVEIEGMWTIGKRARARICLVCRASIGGKIPEPEKTERLLLQVLVLVCNSGRCVKSGVGAPEPMQVWPPWERLDDRGYLTVSMVKTRIDVVATHSGCSTLMGRSATLRRSSRPQSAQVSCSRCCRLFVDCVRTSVSMCM